MLRLMALAVVAIPLIATPAAEAQEDSTDTTLNAYIGCLLKAAAEYDDQKSDASTIASAIIPMCAKEYEADKAAWARTAPNRVAAQMLFDKMDANQLQLATEVVLKERRDRSKSN